MSKSRITQKKSYSKEYECMFKRKINEYDKIKMIAKWISVITEQVIGLLAVSGQAFRQLLDS